jgi:hypothetical protein
VAWVGIAGGVLEGGRLRFEEAPCRAWSLDCLFCKRACPRDLAGERAQQHGEHTKHTMIGQVREVIIWEDSTEARFGQR